MHGFMILKFTMIEFLVSLLCKGLYTFLKTGKIVMRPNYCPEKLGFVFPLNQSHNSEK